MKINDTIKSVTAFAPATCSNLAVGFDLLGFPLADVGDTVKLTRQKNSDLVIEKIEAAETLPYDVDKNVASWGIKQFCSDHGLPCDFSIVIKKGIALGSGMGGSAASVVAGLVALNGFLDEPVSLDVLADYAITSEGRVSGSKHADNAVPCLYGGLTLTRSIEPLDIKQLPHADLYCALVHPELRVDTKDAREILPKEFPLNSVVIQTANLATFISALYEKNYDWLQSCLHDVLIEPWRKQLIKGFEQVQKAALNANALGASISGSGPSMFALAKNIEEAETIKAAMINAFQENNIASKGWASKLNSEGARIIEKRELS